jgi:hypothetical protein
MLEILTSGPTWGIWKKKVYFPIYKFSWIYFFYVDVKKNLILKLDFAKTTFSIYFYACTLLHQ